MDPVALIDHFFAPADRTLKMALNNWFLIKFKYYEILPNFGPVIKNDRLMRQRSQKRNKEFMSP